MAVAALLMIAACSVPAGQERGGCGADWLGLPSVAADGESMRPEALEVACVESVGNRRLQIGFTLPGGPDCHILQRVEIVESADAVSLALFGAVSDDPNAGACADEPRMVVTEVDLAAPVGDRTLLDGNASR